MIALIDYGINETSELTKALSQLGIEYIVTRNEREIINCDKVIISNAQNLLKAVKRIHLLNLFSSLRLLKKPTLGIALGMNLLCNKSNDGITCLGLVDSEIINCTIDSESASSSGMRKIKIIDKNELFNGIKDNSEFYFSNPYYVAVTEHTLAIIDGQKQLSAAIKKDNFYGVRFAPEKSGEQGLRILKNFSQISL
jgi:glutamine amidotransferase